MFLELTGVPAPQLPMRFTWPEYGNIATRLRLEKLAVAGPNNKLSSPTHFPDSSHLPRRSNPKTRTKSSRNKANVGETTLRIVGGHFRGRKLKYAGDTRVRPMKDRVREALFNLLGPAVKGTFAIDLFGGTGALGLEAISRGSVGAIILERHLPTLKVIRENIDTLELDETVETVHVDTFRWIQGKPQLPKADPWVVFVSPPYRFFTERMDETLDLIKALLLEAPYGSLFAVEATKEFDFQALPIPDEWDVRSYPPAVVGVLVNSEAIRNELLAGSE